MAEVVQGAGLTLADLAANRERFALTVADHFEALKAVVQGIEALDLATRAKDDKGGGQSPH